MIGDIGGTNARFALKKINKADKTDRKTLKEETLSTQKYHSFEECIKDFLTTAQGTPDYPIAICIGIAGPTKDKLIKITNADWPAFSVEEVKTNLKV